MFILQQCLCHINIVVNATVAVDDDDDNDDVGGRGEE